MQRIIIVLIILVISNGCNKVTDDEIYENAKSKHETGNYAESLQEYERLIKEFPSTKYKTQSLFEIAKMYHGQVIKSLTEEQNYLKAIDYYKMIIKEFPGSKEAPNSMFMIGFLFANELQEFDSARFYYNRFLEVYPDDPMVVSAKAEIENLGVPTEEFLENLTKSNSEE
ncbi:MAG: tetratricopeptide repeat protein [Melioribacteraceae bacterium]|nr:tetratricopeptide repeat protein [Melioribacteraceae bacterium]